MASEVYLLKRAREFFETRVVPWWSDYACKHPEMGKFAIPLLLSAIFLQLRELAEVQQFGATYFRISPYTVTGGGEAVRILDKESQGRTRKVSIWVDSATGGPLPTLRISTGATSSAGGGIRVTPGQVNELDVIPPNTQLWAASSQTIVVYVIERA